MPSRIPYSLLPSRVSPSIRPTNAAPSKHSMANGSAVSSNSPRRASDGTNRFHRISGCDERETELGAIAVDTSYEMRSCSARLAVCWKACAMPKPMLPPISAGLRSTLTNLRACFSLSNCLLTFFNAAVSSLVIVAVVVVVDVVAVAASLPAVVAPTVAFALAAGRARFAGCTRDGAAAPAAATSPSPSPPPLSRAPPPVASEFNDGPTELNGFDDA